MNFIQRLTGIGVDEEEKEEEDKRYQPVTMRKDKSEAVRPNWERQRELTTPVGKEKNPSDIEWTYEEDWADMGTLRKVFDVLQRDQYASANVARGLIEGDDNLAKNAWDGLTGKEKGTYIDILENYDIPWAPVLGTALDIGLSPSSYLPGPVKAFKKIAGDEGVDAARKTVSNLIRGDIPGVGKIGNVVDWLGHAFDPDYGIADDLAFKTWSENYNFSSDKVYALKNIRKKLGGIDEQTSKLMTEWRRTGTRPTDPDQLNLLNQGLDILQEATDTALDFGFISEAAVDSKTIEGFNTYLPTVLNKHVDSWTGAQDIFRSMKAPSFSLRQTSDFNINDWRKLSAHFDDLAKLDSTDNILSTAKKKLASDAYPQFTDETMGAVEKIVQNTDNAAKAKELLHSRAVDYTPVDEFDKLLSLYNAELAQGVHQDNVIRYALQGSENADQWRKVLSAGDTKIPEESTGVVRLNELKKALGKMDDEAKNEFHGLLGGKVMSQAKGKFFDLTDDVPDTLIQKIASDDALDVPVYSLDTEVMDYLTRAEDFYTPRTEGGKLAQWYDKILGKWKRSATMLRMPFHMRNLMTNQVRMYQGGMDLSDLGKFGAKAAKIQLGGDDIIELGGVKKSADDWLQLWSSKGVRGWGYVGEMDPTEFASGVPAEVTDREHYINLAKDMIGGDITVDKIRDLMGAPSDLGGWVGHIIEDNARISDAMWATQRAMRDDGLKFADAIDEGAQHSWKHLFQYDQLTEMERSTFKRVVPFYTWMRKNTELQAEKLLTDPARSKKAYQAMEGLRYVNPQSKREQEYTPDYMQELSFFKLPDGITDIISEDESRPVYANIDMPWDDINALADHPVRTFLSSLSPVSIAAKMGLNVQNFPVLGVPIEKFEGELVPAPGAFSMLPSQAWGLFGIEEMRHPETGKKVLGMPSKGVQALYDIVPPLREINSMFPQSGIELEREPESPWSKLKYITGTQISPVNHNQQMLYERIENNKKMSDVAKRVSQLGRQLTTEELEEYLQD